MYKQNIKNSLTASKPGLISHILLQKDTVPNCNLAITWVEVEPGFAQTPHSHPPEQVYIIIQGEGKMIVGQDEENVTVGDLIYIPSNAVHSIKNVGKDNLIYISSTTPAINIKALYK